MRFLRTVHKLKNGAVHKNETTVHMFEKTQGPAEKFQTALPVPSAGYRLLRILLETWPAVPEFFDPVLVMPLS